MRVAFVGKGGAGKSAVAGTFARMLARSGARVLAVDSDPMPGLAFSLGLGDVEGTIPEDAVVEREGGGPGPRWVLRPDLLPADAVKRFSVKGPDGVRFLQFAKLRGHASVSLRSQVAFRSILDGLPPGRWSLVGDLPGGTRQPFFGWGRYADTYLVVVEPSAKSILSARRLARVDRLKDAPARVLAVANKVRSAEDLERVRAKVPLPVVAAVPWDEAMAEADRQGVALVDLAPGSPAVEAVGLLVEQLSGGGRR